MPAEEDQTKQPRPRPRLIVLIASYLVSHSSIFSVVCCIAGLIAILLLPVLAKNTYISENALMPVIFSLARMITGPYLMYVTCSADNPLIIKAMTIGLQLVNVFWFYKIVRMVNHKIGKRIAATKDVKTISNYNHCNKLKT